MNNSDYLRDAYYANREAWLGSDGSIDGYGGGGNNSPVSLPYIIQIVNACTSAITDVDVGDSYANRAGVSAGPWNFNQNASITITSALVGVTYIEFLAQSESKPFKVGTTMLISSSSGQIEQPVTITHRNASGDRQDHVITPTIDAYQTQTDRIIDDYEYLFDGYSRARFSQVNGSATVTLRMYQVGMFTATQIVAGRNSNKSYLYPHIVRAF